MYTIMYYKKREGAALRQSLAIRYTVTMTTQSSVTSNSIQLKFVAMPILKSPKISQMSIYKYIYLCII